MVQTDPQPKRKARRVGLGLVAVVVGGRVAPVEQGPRVAARLVRVAPAARGLRPVVIAAPAALTGAGQADVAASVGAETMARTAAARLARRDVASVAVLGWALPWSGPCAGRRCLLT
ncbi:MAG: hypothetical protein QOH93_3295 [Chloroflexia bacterium]|jgi:hypothetical protein|nr:hypothetical protein [Chloroflexia bacterium]